jgi:hypothetical protein
MNLALKNPFEPADEAGLTGQPAKRGFHPESGSLVLLFANDNAAPNAPPDARLDLRYRMPNGRLLTDYPQLLEAVREIIELRARRADVSINAVRLKNYGLCALQLAYATARRGKNSFAELDRRDLEDLVGDVSAGADGLVRASEQLRHFGERFATISEVPRHLLRKSKSGYKIHVKRLFFECGIPDGLANTRPVQRELALVVKRWVCGESEPKPVPPTEVLKDAAITAQYAGTYTSILEALFKMRGRMRAKGLLFNPFSGSAGAEAATIGRETSKTPLAPPLLCLKFMENTTRFLFANREQIVDEYRAVLLQPSPSVASTAQCRQRLSTLATACFVLISLFTARRYNEVMSIERGCLAGNDSYGWWMQVIILKKRRQERTWIPVPHLVARAVETMRLIGDHVPDVSERTRLFSYRFPTEAKVICFDPSKRLDAFAEGMDARVYANDNSQGKIWHWQPRQFRRFFCVFYFFRYKGNVEALTHHLRHYSIEETLGYLKRDPEISRIWFEEQWGFKMHIATSIAVGSLNYSGAMGTYYKRFKDRLASGYQKHIHLVRDVPSTMVEAWDRRGLVIRPRKWVDCACPDDPKKACRAICRLGHVFKEGEYGPDMENAGPGPCSRCMYAFQDEEARRFVARVMGESTERQPATDMVSMFAERGLAMLERIVSPASEKLERSNG